MTEVIDRRTLHRHETTVTVAGVVAFIADD